MALPLGCANAQAAEERIETAWPYLERYRAQNASLSPPEARREPGRAHGAASADDHSPMAGERQGMKSDLATDGVHPNEAAYRSMAPLARKAIAEALRRKERR